jgi:hypothetical protein
MKRSLFIGLVMFMLCLLQFPVCAQNPSLDYSISKLFASTGGTGIIRVTSGSSCAWQASSSASWITIASGGSGTGPGNVQYTIANNTGAQRTGTVTVAGQTYPITQTGK